jgi:DNA-binding NtrC family response regulator
MSRELVPEPVSRHVRELCAAPESPSVIVLTRREDPEERARLLASGAEEVLGLSTDEGMLREIVLGVAERRRDVAAERLRTAHPDGAPRLSDFVSASPSMQAFMDVVHRVYDSDTSLLLLGETGVGKERLARAIHGESARAGGPFVAVNCGAIPEALLESELFGHERGAFTGASRARRGWFELGHGGTVFLDEIADLPTHVQVKLLRVLQERAVQPLGGERTMHVDVRIMAASNRSLEAEVERGAFRRDLFYRLSVVTLEMPPLRERRQDVPDLVASYLDHFSRTIGREVSEIDEAALAALVDHDWPGNVRELINVLERAVLLCRRETITLDDLPDVIRGPARVRDVVLPEDGAEPVGLPDPAWLERPLREVRRSAVEAVERAYLHGLLERTAGAVGETARRAGITPRALYGKMRTLGLRKEDYRRSGGDHARPA